MTGLCIGISLTSLLSWRLTSKLSGVGRKISIERIDLQRIISYINVLPKCIFKLLNIQDSDGSLNKQKAILWTYGDFLICLSVAIFHAALRQSSLSRGYEELLLDGMWFWKPASWLEHLMALWRKFWLSSLYCAGMNSRRPTMPTQYIKDHNIKLLLGLI